MEKLYGRTNAIKKDAVSGFCPGCMHGTVHKLIGEVLEELDIVNKTACVLGVGCCGLGMEYITYDNTTSPPWPGLRRGHGHKAQQSRHGCLHLSGGRRPGLHRPCRDYVRRQPGREYHGHFHQ